MPQNLLTQKKCFKLICAAGNRDIEQVEKLVFVYAKAGVRFFDLGADNSVIKAAYNVLTKFEIKDFSLCVSIGIGDDPHFKEAFINTQSCISCRKCLENCPQKAIFQDKNYIKVDPKKCIGCSLCLKYCPVGAISLIGSKKTLQKSIENLDFSKVSCLEIHTNGGDLQELEENWNHLNSSFKGFLSLCISQYSFGEDTYKQITKHLVNQRKPYTTIIQADGLSMSGYDDQEKTTQKAIEAAKLVIDMNLPVFVLPSGGTNSQTSRLAKENNINIDGVAIGSYARKIIFEEINKNDFWENEQLQNNAIKKATELVNQTLKWLHKT